MKKKKYQDQENFLDKKSRLDSMKYPELNESDVIFDKAKNEFVKLLTEQHKRIKLGFYHSNIISQLRPRALKLFIIILCCTGREQSTYAGNKKLSRLSGISEVYIGKKKDSYLNELEYWHLIEKHLKPNRWNPKKKSRTITILRWDTARELLLKEGKIIKAGKSYIAKPNPFIKKR